MKVFALCYLIPLTIALSLTYNIAKSAAFNQLLFENPVLSTDSSKVCIRKFENQPVYYQNRFLNEGPNADMIFILGSSEVQAINEAVPHFFINQHFSTKVQSVGDDGNQSFSMYSQLLANEERLNHLPITIIITPMWFQSYYAYGTSTEKFLDYTTDNFLNKIIHNDSISLFKQYESETILTHYTRISSPSAALKTFYLSKKVKENIFCKLFYTPLLYSNQLIADLKTHTINNHATAFDGNIIPQRTSFRMDDVEINWDSLFMHSKQDVLKTITNNNWGIEDDAYNTYVKGKTYTIKVLSENENKEWKDFNMLLELLRHKKANASFVILPMNPYYFVNINELSPLINKMHKEITAHNFKCLNLWASDTSHFEKGMLWDVVHPTKYCWYKIDKFMIETYGLNKHHHE